MSAEAEEEVEDEEVVRCRLKLKAHDGHMSPEMLKQMRSLLEDTCNKHGQTSDSFAKALQVIHSSFPPPIFSKTAVVDPGFCPGGGPA